MFESGFHRLAFFFGLASVAVWTYVFNEWWGGEWWGLLLAVAAAIPVGTRLLDPAFDTARNVEAATHRERRSSHVVIHPRGIAFGVYALIAFEGTTLAMVSLAGAEIFVGGLGHFYMRLNAMRYAAMGEASEDDVSLPGRKPPGCGRRG